MAGDRERSSPLGTRYVERFLRRTFGLAGPTVADHVRGDVSPSIDVRPLLPWEFRDFGIRPFGRVIVAPAVPAASSYIEVQPLIEAFDVVVTEIHALTAIDLFLHNTSQAAGTLQPAVHLDSFFAPGTYGTATTPFSIRFGSVAVVAGTQVDGLPLNAVRVNQHYLLRFEGGTPNLVAAGAINTAIAVGFYGFAIPADVSRI